MGWTHLAKMSETKTVTFKNSAVDLESTLNTLTQQYTGKYFLGGMEKYVHSSLQQKICHFHTIFSWPNSFVKYCGLSYHHTSLYGTKELYSYYDIDFSNLKWANNNSNFRSGAQKVTD